MVYENRRQADIRTYYWNNSVLKPRPLYHTDFEDALENIVVKKEPEKEKDALGRIFSDKRKTLKSTIKALFNEIKLREGLDSSILYKINQDICRENSYCLNLQRTLRYSYSIDLNKDLTNIKMKLEDRVLELEKEKRKEYLECWRDLMVLKKYLLSTLKDYWELSRKTGILSYDFKGLGNFHNENRKGDRGDM